MAEVGGVGAPPTSGMKNVDLEYVWWKGPGEGGNAGELASLATRTAGRSGPPSSHLDDERPERRRRFSSLARMSEANRCERRMRRRRDWTLTTRRQLAAVQEPSVEVVTHHHGPALADPEHNPNPTATTAKRDEGPW